MKNIQKYIVIVSFFSVVIAFASCKKDDVDNTKPTITVVEPANDQEFQPGGTIHFDAEFADDIELKSYKIDIHFNDGHSHTKKLSKVETPWDFENTWDFEAGKKNADVHQDIVIPQDAKHGAYHFGIYCTDKAGNETSVFIDILVEGVHP